MDNLEVADNQVLMIPPGGHFFDKLTLGKGAELQFSQTVSIVAKSLNASAGSKIKYVHGNAAPTDQKVFTIHAINAKGVSEISFLGDGLNAIGYQAGVEGTPGPDGNQASGTSWEHPLGGDASGGSDAPSPAAPGPRGENAVNFVVSLPFLNPGARLNFSSLGGNGGRGQDGGHGGKGGDGNNLKGPKRGGRGAVGGTGGDGGDAGTVTMLMVIPKDDARDRDDVIASVHIDVRNAAGNPGDVGEPGPPGRGGTANRPGEQNSPAGELASRGLPGNPGRDAKNVPDVKWVTIDVMDFETYAAWLAAVIGDPTHADPLKGAPRSIFETMTTAIVNFKYEPTE